MQKIKGKSLQKIEGATTYERCSFYLEKGSKCGVGGSVFGGCSFRSDVIFADLEGCEFINCGFYGKLELDLSGKKLVETPSHVFQLQNLSKLNLSYNKISELFPEFAQLQNLSELYLSFNKINKLLPEFGQLQNLSHLNISSNDLFQLK
ncbi:leucine-rich repeat domain-containing protein [Candidatus Uabimicrobium sp. HlEnr_7]|uniref:leucine-rich repeat domain-containing protein n=1 Tax=Candidatus Uabimicrobium helgolandensis TaxID=3095367 RepID=UPI003555D82E